MVVGGMKKKAWALNPASKCRIHDLLGSLRTCAELVIRIY